MSIAASREVYRTGNRSRGMPSLTEAPRGEERSRGAQTRGLGRSAERGAVTDGEGRHPGGARRVAANHLRRHRRGDGRNIEARGQQVAMAGVDDAAREPKVKAEGEALPEEAGEGTPRVGGQEGSKELGVNGGAGATRQLVGNRERRGRPGVGLHR